MKVVYRQLFLKDLKKLKKTDLYDRIHDLAFNTLPELAKLQDIPNIKAMVGYPGHYRIRLGDYRLGFRLHDNELELMRVMHRCEFYRYFP